MSLSSTTNRNDYVGNGSTETYSYSFRIFDQSHLRVIVKETATGVETTLAITTDYTVTGVGQAAGGTVVLVDAGQDWIDAEGDLDSGYEITIRRVVPITQLTDIRNQGDFYPEVHEDVFDKQIMISQQQQDDLDRAARMPQTVPVSTFDPQFPADLPDNPGAVVIVNQAGDGFETGPTADAIEDAQANATAAAASAVAAVASETDAEQHKTTAERWAKKTDGSVIDADTLVDSSEYSSKAYAVGGTGVTDVSGKGASKEWATKTGGTVDTSEYSAKEYAQGTTAGVLGSAKDWAQKTSAAVTGSLYSAKEWALGVLTRGLASGGSAKDWANYTGGTVDNAEYSAKKYAQDAAASAASAQWDDVSFKVFGDSPITVADGDAGVLFNVDCSGGNIVVNLPQISALTLSSPWSIGFKKTDTSANTITINRGGTDTFDDASTSKTISYVNQGMILVPDTDAAPDEWTVINFGDLSTLYSPTINTPTTDVVRWDDQASTPSNPSAGFYKTYFKTNGFFYALNSSGVEQQFSFGGSAGTTAKTGNYTIVSGDNNKTILVNSSGGAFSLTLPSAVDGFSFIVKDTTGSLSTNNVTVARPGSEKIDNITANYLLQTNYGSYRFISNGTDWFII